MSLNSRSIWFKFKSSFAYMIFNLNPVLNFNLFLEEKVFLIFHSIRLKILVNFRAGEEWFSQFW
jgi:hypothetical protein